MALVYGTRLLAVVFLVIVLRQHFILANYIPINYFSGHGDGSTEKKSMKIYREKFGRWITRIIDWLFGRKVPGPIEPTKPWPRTAFSDYTIEPMQDLEYDGITAIELQALMDAHSTESIKDPFYKDWNEQAWDLLLDYIFLEGKGHEFLAEEFVAFAKELMKPPTDARSWGTPIRRAAKAGIITKIGYRPAQTSNRSPKCLWRVV